MKNKNNIRKWEEIKNTSQKSNKKKPKESGIKNIIIETKKILTKRQKKDITIKRWTKKEIDFLIKNFKNKTDKEIGNLLFRNERSVLNKRKNLKLKKRDGKFFHKNCLFCSSVFRVTTSTSHIQCCSLDCKYEYSKVKNGTIRECLHCEKKFHFTGGKTVVNRGKFCSRQCCQKHRKNGKILKCEQCKKETSKSNWQLKKHKHFFCSRVCANKFQICKKVKLNCKMCNCVFEVYPSTIKHSKLRKQKTQYCSLKCSNLDPQKLENLRINRAKQNKNKKPNKLEVAGNLILNELKLKFKEQHLINNKICVDVFIKKYNLIIQWDGDYWHGKKIKNNIPDERQKHRMDLDYSQDRYLKKCGYNILRFWESEVHKNKFFVISTIKKYGSYISVYTK